MGEQRSTGGSRIFRHGTIAPAAGDVAHADDALISAHLERHLGAGGWVWHEMLSDRIHLDIHVSPATNQRPYSVLATSGMSALPMNLPEGLPHAEKWRHAELCLLLPATWSLEQSSFRDDNVYWPIRLLKQLGRLPHDYNTWLSWGHSVPNGEPPQGYSENTQLCGSIIMPPYVLGTEFFELHHGDDELIHFFQVVPVHAAEMAYKLKHGIDELVNAMASCAGSLDAIDAGRGSAV